MNSLPVSHWYFPAMAFLFGAVVGSFLNVVICRLPLGQSIVSPASHCPQCKRAVKWYDNVPLLGYMVLGGRCRACGWHIPVRYVLVEFIAAAAAAVVVWFYGVSLEALWVFSFVAVMLAITLIDWDHQIIPDQLSLGGTVWGWVGALVCLPIGFVDSLVGSVVGAGTILLIAGMYKWIRKVDGMGGGDVKLMAMIGAFLGWKMVFPVLLVAALVGSVYGTILMRRGHGDGKTAVAFGSFLAPAACVVMFWGARLIDLYLGMMYR